VKQRLAPAWTTDWIGPAAREKLRAYGIAPPVGAACAGALTPAAVACPRCGSMATERISQFGSTPCKAAYRCTGCLEPFDYFKAH
jgi:ring-1,2-phenylacetyl-CoA epoxidase subunit PaaD